jgi:hypothetical protein
VRKLHPRRTRVLLTCVIAGIAATTLAACTPTVKVEAPDKPIVINLNVKIEQEVRVKVDRDVDTLLQNNPNLF